MSGRRHQYGTRLLGTVVGLGFCLLGTYAVLGAPAVPDPVPAGRVLWYGITLIVVGVIAVAASWYVEDADTIWCRPPRRGR
ncbi:MAG: hypothetical protein ACREMB_06105 [Candidatus Rokuibacteriota bacterium]